MKHSKRRIRACIVAVATIVTASIVLRVHAADPAHEILRAMRDATRELNYDGVFVYQRGIQLDSMRLVHQYDGGNVKERLISLSGPAREVLRDGSFVTCLFADDHAAMVEKMPPRDLIHIGFSGNIDTLQESYHFTLERGDRVAGRAALVLAVTPKSPDRYAYRLWIDEQSKLLLKSIILGRGGRILEQVQFTQITVLDAIPAQLLEPEIAGTGFTWRTEQGENNTVALARETAWAVNWVPHGFVLRENNIQNMATSQMPVGHLVYSDGLAMVSVFIEKSMPDEVPLQGYSARGAINAFSRLSDEHQITVVGELPVGTVRQIASSVARTGN